MTEISILLVTKKYFRHQENKCCSTFKASRKLQNSPGIHLSSQIFWLLEINFHKHKNVVFHHVKVKIYILFGSLKL